MSSTTNSSSPDPRDLDITSELLLGEIQHKTLRNASQILGRNTRSKLEEAPFWQEVIAFNQLPSAIIDEFYGRFVAVYQGNIVDSDNDEGELALRFYRTFGYVPVYIHKVGTEDGLIDTDDV